MRSRIACLPLLLLTHASLAATPEEAFSQCEHWLRELGAMEVPKVPDAGDEKSFFFHWKGARMVRMADNRMLSAACVLNRHTGHGQLSIDGKPPVSWRPQAPATAQSP